MTKFQQIAQELIDHKIAFHAYKPGSADSPIVGIEVTESLNNEQLAVLIKHGGFLEKNGIVRLLINNEPDDPNA